ncbi:unnamed protein product [Acanthoscelides obtectus]|uniref:Uncharacterized protein n=1 Tax=Acanthoscelides obtectus TaxID=200917 RepID=A0A9P0LHZ5_ACAOB|nr:unnamed protein product [Acanthoscelides obtectus]CAK1656850.1 hypothetical protein AOBTE_LOCUS19961 [Acanthoscelides obtectus]
MTSPVRDCGPYKTLQQGVSAHASSTSNLALNLCNVSYMVEYSRISP